MLHDVLISVGIYSLFQFLVTPSTLIAFLTILGFSLYDAIVVFEFEGIQRLRLEGEEEGDRSVIRGLKVGLTEQGYRLELFPSHGIGGEIVADDIAIRIEGGR